MAHITGRRDISNYTSPSILLARGSRAGEERCLGIIHWAKSHTIPPTEESWFEKGDGGRRFSFTFPWFNCRRNSGVMLLKFIKKRG